MKLTIAFAGVLALAYACGEPETTVSNSVRRPVPVTVMESQIERGPVTVLRSARIRAELSVALAAESSGRLVSWEVAEGSRVEAGTLLARLTSGAEAAEEAAAREERDRLHGIDASQSDRILAAARWSRAKDALDKREVRAPADGYVDRFHLDAGAWASAGMPVADFVGSGPLELVVTLLEDEVLLAQVGDEVRFSVPAHPGREFKGRITRRAHAALTGSGSFEVAISIPESSALRPGFVATVSIPLGTERTRRLLPAEAVYRRFGQDRAALAVPDDAGFHVEERAVQAATIPGSPEWIEITEGIDDGDRVIIRGLAGLTEGDAVLPTAGPER